MILVENSRNLELDSLEESEDGYETTNEDEFEDNENNQEEEEGFLPSLGFNNYFNNLNLNLNLNLKLNDRFNAFETSCWKLYENAQNFAQNPPVSIPKAPRSFEVISNLWKQLADEESEAQLKRLEFQEVQKKATEEVRRRLEPKIKSKNHLQNNGRRNSDLLEGGLESELGCENSDCITSPEVDDLPKLDQEFWSQFFGFKTEENSNGNGGETPVQTSVLQSQPKPPTNPFYSRLHLTYYDKFKTGLMTIFLPIRCLGMLTCLVLACVMSKIGTLGLTLEETNQAPLAKWRRAIRWVTAHVFMRAMFFCAGFHWVRRIGKQASRKEAPIFIIAPHSSYFDAFVVILLGGPSVVAKDEAKYIPFFGRLIDFTQPIYVKREESQSRKACVMEINKRVQSEDEEWPQVFLFPEGTCTNRSALAQFKPGPFLAGVPVQPVIIRYPNRLDSVTWTFDSPSAYYSAWVTLTQFHNSIEIEYLPVYKPSEAEKNDVKLFVHNVQQVMADALGVPRTEFTMEDGIVLAKLAKTQLRRKLETIWKIKGDLNLRESPTETTLVYEGITSTSPSFSWKAQFDRFQSEIFKIQADSPVNPEVEALFNLFKENESSTIIDLRAYLLLTCFMYDFKLDMLITIMFHKYAGKGASSMHREDFVELMKNLFESSDKEANDLFNAGLDSDAPKITFGQFQNKVNRRVEYVKLYAMEATGLLSGNFPRRENRDQFSQLQSKSKVD